jgi:hypothetical protein
MEPEVRLLISSREAAIGSHPEPNETSAHIPNLFIYLRFEVFTAVTMKNGVFWDTNAVWLL